MSPLHPALVGSPVTVWFVDGIPVRLVCARARLRVEGSPRSAVVDGRAAWRIRTRADGRLVTMDIAWDGERWILTGAAEERVAAV